MMYTSIPITRVPSLLRLAYAANLPLLLEGSHGIGKSSIFEVIMCVKFSESDILQKSESLLSLKKHILTPLVFLLFYSQNVVLAEASYSVAVAETMTKVNPDASAFQKGIANAQINMAKNEHEGIQLVVLAEKTHLNRVRLTYGDFKQDNGNGRIEAENISWRVVKYIHGNYKKDVDVSDPANIKHWPDPLMEQAIFNVVQGAAQPIWLDVYAPADTPAGIYRGKVYIEPDGQSMTVVPITVKVWNFTLPKENHLRSMFLIWNDALAKYHNVSERDPKFREIRKKYVKAYLKHRVSPAQPCYYPLDMKYTLNEDGSTQIDWSEFDREMQNSLDAGLNTFHWPGSIIMYPKRMQLYTGGPFIWDAKKQKYVWLDFVEEEDWIARPSSGEDKRLKEECRKIARHLKEKGWLDKCAAYVVGEPHKGRNAHSPAVEDFEYARRMFKWMHEVDPGIKTMVSMIGAPLSKEIAGDIDIWGIDSSVLYKVTEREKEEKAKGREVWTYMPWIYRIDWETGAWRIGPWYCWKYKIDGFGPMTDITAWFSGDPWARETYVPGKFPNCWIIYPGKDGPVGSVRFEMLRDGMEDYEYLWMLDKLTAKLEQVNPNSSLISSARKLLNSDDRIIKGRKPVEDDHPWPPTGQWNFSGETFRRVRNELGNLCEQIQTAIEQKKK